MNLSPAFFNRAGFIAGVFVLGLILGYSRHKTGGIGWAILVHTGLDLVIEWNNIS